MSSEACFNKVVLTSSFMWALNKVNLIVRLYATVHPPMSIKSNASLLPLDSSLQENARMIQQCGSWGFMSKRWISIITQIHDNSKEVHDGGRSRVRYQAESGMGEYIFRRSDGMRGVWAIRRDLMYKQRPMAVIGISVAYVASTHWSSDLRYNWKVGDGRVFSCL